MNGESLNIWDRRKELQHNQEEDGLQKNMEGGEEGICEEVYGRREEGIKKRKMDNTEEKEEEEQKN
jgi:hypothetical protein